MINTENLSIDEFKSQSIEHPTIRPPIYTEANSLPIAELPWEWFERLCAYLADEIWGNSTIYLKPGYKQDGIDIYCTPDNLTQPFIFIQCKKREKNLTKTEIEHAVNEFINGKFNRRGTRFIICTSGALDSKAHEAIISQSEKLNQLNVNLEIWDKRKLTDKLRGHQKVVYEIFDRDEHAKWTEKICGRVDQVINRYLPIINKPQLPAVENFIDRSIYVNESESQLNHLYLRKAKRYDILELIKGQEFNHIVLLSEAGSGKTAFIRQLGHQLSDVQMDFLPVFLDLKNYEGEFLDDFLGKLKQNLEKYDPAKLVFLFDGFDEISADRIESATKKINIFAQGEKYDKSRIVITIRTNFFNEQFESFQAFYLGGITDFDIIVYIEKVLGAEKEEFLNLIVEKNLKFLLYNFFSLNELTNLFKKNGSKNFPNNRKDVFEQIIERKIQSNNDHFKFSGKQLADRTEEIILNLERLSIILTQIGKDVLPLESIRKIFPKKEDREIIMYSFLLRKEEKGRYLGFEHKSYHEYLTAKILSRQPLEKIKGLVAFSPHFIKVKPRWVNTISFLFSIIPSGAREYRELLEWLLENEPEIVIKFEQASISPELKINVLRQILDDYERRDMVFIGSFSYEEVARFCGNDNKVVSFLISDLQSTKQINRMSNVLCIIREWAYVYKSSKEIYHVLADIIKSNSDLNILRISIEAYFNLNFLKCDIDYVIQNCININHHRVRSPIYEAIWKLKLSDDYIDFLLTGIIEERTYTKSYNVIDSSYYLIECIKRCTAASSIKRILQFFVENYASIFSPYNSSLHSEKIFTESFIENCIAAYKLDPNIANEIKDILLIFIENSEEDIPLIIKFTRATESALSIAKSILSSTVSIFRIAAVGAIGEDKCSDFILDKYAKSEITINDIYSYRYNLSRYNTKGHNYFQDKLLLLYGDEFMYPKKIDYQSVVAARHKGDLEVLKDKDRFLADIREIFSEFGTDKLTFADISKWRKDHNIDSDFYKNNIVPRLIQKSSSNQESICYEDIVKRFDSSEKWEWHVVCELYHMLANKMEIDNWHNEYLVNWSLKELSNCDFRNSLKATHNNGLSYGQREFILQFLWRKYNFRISESIMLDMLSFDWSGIYRQPNVKSENLSDTIIDRISNKHLVENRILENLKSDIAVKDVLANHIKLCGELEIRQAIGYVCKAIKGCILDSHTKKRAIDIYIGLGGTYIDFKETVKTEDPNLEHVEYLLEGLYKQEPEFVLEVIKKVLYKIETQNRFFFINILIDNGDIEGFQLLIEHFKATKSDLPILHDNKISLIKYEADIILKPLLEVLLLSYSSNFNKTSQFDQMSGSILSILTNFGLTNEANYIKVRNGLEQFIKDHQVHEPKVVSLNYSIANLDANFQLNKENLVSLDDAIKNIESFF